MSIQEKYDALRKERCQGEYSYIAVKEELVKEIQARGVVITALWVEDAIQLFLKQTEGKELDDKYTQRKTLTAPSGDGANQDTSNRPSVGRTNWRKTHQRP